MSRTRVRVSSEGAGCTYTLWLHTITHSNTLQHTATNCNTLQHTATHCNESFDCGLWGRQVCFCVCVRQREREGVWVGVWVSVCVCMCVCVLLRAPNVYTHEWCYYMNVSSHNYVFVLIFVSNIHAYICVSVDVKRSCTVFNVLQYVAVCCSLLRCVAVCCSVL